LYLRYAGNREADLGLQQVSTVDFPAMAADD
jgi:hypothetical protein